MPDTPTEQPEDKDLQDHKFGMTAARKAEEAEQAAGAGGAEGQRAEVAGHGPHDTREMARETEPHAGGKA